MKLSFSGVASVIAIVIAIIACFLPHPVTKSGAITDTSYFDYFNAATGGGFQLNGTTIHNATVLKTTTAGGTLTVTTSDSATSTAVLGCVQMAGTTTASQMRLVIGASSISTTTLRSGTAATNFTVYAQPGTCP